MRVEPRASASWTMDDASMIAALRGEVAAAALIEVSVETQGPPSSADRTGTFARWVDDEMGRSAARLRGTASPRERSDTRSPAVLEQPMTIGMQNTLQRIDSAVRTVCVIAIGNSVLEGEYKEIPG